jgi:hypothetical protein
MRLEVQNTDNVPKGTIGTMPYPMRFLLLLLLVMAYLAVWRPVRVVLVSDLIRPVVTVLAVEGGDVSVEPKKGASLIVRKPGSSAEYVFSGFANSFFLLGAAYFLIAGFGWRPVLWLFALHQGITLLAAISLFLAVGSSSTWIYPMNFLVTYITPAATGMFVLTWRKR